MLFSLALIIITGFTLGGILQKLKLPSLLGMIFTGIILGPYMLNLIAPTILAISVDLREIALIVILTRAGMALDLQDLKKVGRPAILMCFIPATFELVAVAFFAPLFLDVSRLEAAIMGAVLAAVSPAVVVPRMLRLIDDGYGKSKSIPQLIMAGASVDDIYVIVIFTSFLNMYQGQSFDVLSLIKIPVSIILGLMIGILIGFLLVFLFKKIHMRDTIKILLMFSTAFLLISLENALKTIVPLSGLLAVMAFGAAILRKHGELAKRLSAKYSKIWVGAELILFVLVGAAVDVRYIGNAGISATALIFTVLSFRTTGVFVCLLKTNLNKKEKVFTAISYLPKATVQAAIGGIPLSVGVATGNTILTVAVLAILITAPLGAIGIDRSYKQLLSRDNSDFYIKS